MIPVVRAADAARHRRGREPRAGGGPPVPEIGALAAGEVGGFAVGGVELRRRAGSAATCSRTATGAPAARRAMAGARLERWAGQPVGAGVLTCPRCRAHYDVRRAGAAIDARRGAPAAVPPAGPRRRAVRRAARRAGRARAGRARAGRLRPGERTVPVSALRRITRSRPRVVRGERCEMCAEPIGDSTSARGPPRQPRADVHLPRLLPAVHRRGTPPALPRRARALPVLPGLPPRRGQWAALEIPVGLAFFFASSVSGRTVAFYPGPAGATESELPLGAWSPDPADNPQLDTPAARHRGADRAGARGERAMAEAYLVPIDACYELVGLLRQVWRGFDGGQDARARDRDVVRTSGSSRRPVATVRQGAAMS